MFRAFAFVDDLFPVPRIYLGFLHARLALRPSKTTSSMCITRRIFSCQRTNVVRNPEADEAFNLLFLLFEEWIELPLVRDDETELFKVQLIGNAPVITRFQAAQEALLVECLHHLLVPWIISRHCSQQLLYFFRKLII